MGNVTLGANAVIRLNAGTYEWNSVTMNGNVTLIIESGPVIMRIAGEAQTTPINLTGGSISNNTYKPENFQLIYAPSAADIAAIAAGTLTRDVKVSGGAETALLMYAPRADGTVVGGSDLYRCPRGQQAQGHGRHGHPLRSQPPASGHDNRQPDDDVLQLEQRRLTRRARFARTRLVAESAE